MRPLLNTLSSSLVFNPVRHGCAGDTHCNAFHHPHCNNAFDHPHCNVFDHPMAPQRGQQGGIRSGRHDDVNIAGRSNTPFLSQDIVQVDQQGDHPAIPAALIQSIHEDVALRPRAALRGVSSSSLKAVASSERDSTCEGDMARSTCCLPIGWQSCGQKLHGNSARCVFAELVTI